MSKHRSWVIYRDDGEYRREWVEEVHTAPDVSPYEVLDDLVEHDGYPATIYTEARYACHNEWGQFESRTDEFHYLRSRADIEYYEAHKKAIHKRN
jgi:hypothetical protein